MWTIKTNVEYEARSKHKDWSKKYRREFASVHDNLDTVVVSLANGVKVEEIRKFGFVHNEPRGVIGIDQKGGGGGLKETRLYVYVDTTSQVVYIITLGDKRSQRDDIRYSTQFVDSLLKK